MLHRLSMCHNGTCPCSQGIPLDASRLAEWCNAHHSAANAVRERNSRLVRAGISDTPRHSGRLARRRQRHPRLHHRRPRRSLLRSHPRRDRQHHLAPPARRISRNLAGYGESLGVSVGGECGVKGFGNKTGRGEGYFCSFAAEKN